MQSLEFEKRRSAASAIYRPIIKYLNKLISAEINFGGIFGKIHLLALVFFLVYVFNDYELFRFINSVGPNSPYISEKIQNPFEQLDTSNDPSKHFEKISYRLVPFVIAYVLNLNHEGLFYLQFILGLAFPLLTWMTLKSESGSIQAATAGSLLLTTMYCGHSFFMDWTFFDAFGYLFLLLAMMARNRLLIILLCLLAGFTDERGVIASPLVFAWHWYLSGDLSLKGLVRQASWFALVFILYVTLRLAIGALTDLHTPLTGISVAVLWGNLRNIILLTWSVFEGGWLLLGYVLFLLFDRKQALFICVTAICAAPILLGSLFLGDVIRSQQYAFPLLLLALLIAGQHGFPTMLWRPAFVLTLVTPITIYLGFIPSNDWIANRYIYNMYHLKPTYLYVPYLVTSTPIREFVESSLHLNK